MRTDSSEIDELFSLCSDPHRRIVLSTLLERDRVMTRDELTEAIVVHNHHVAIEEIDDAERSRITGLLHHVHLPKLADSGYLEYDHQRTLVAPSARLDAARSSLLSVLDVDLPNEAV